ncbi:GNAT family N-acetyltransferase [Kribbella capetownensis]|uniref:GNAT family N-acetyltransferase n=1 Tax=Kribbella capetownensis TaxID=1572659 RepID=A0A4R0JXJ6_9ACTN|nr:GNAT family N-acetyltransferase [Kribbella capetownensis]TCC52261.1 GNAT family N-acetyltransferase [Kribbella capetownensis]
MDDLLRRWVDGWRRCRGLEPAIEYDDAFAVVLRLPGRDRELFARADDPAVVDHLVARTSEDVWLTVTTQHGDEITRRLSAAGLEPFAEQKVLMSIELADQPQPEPPASYQVTTQTDDALEYVRLLHEGEVAARGMVAIVDNDAVMHDIHTDPAHRRRGLGSVVMGALSRRAIERGARTGLLMATTEGVRLYTKLGWLPEATMVTATGSGGAGPVGGDLGAVLAGR